jgi:hypothetical protein
MIYIVIQQVINFLEHSNKITKVLSNNDMLVHTPHCGSGFAGITTPSSLPAVDSWNPSRSTLSNAGGDS